MNLASAEDRVDFYSALDDIWDTFQEDVVIVKEPIVSANLTGVYMPGWGQTGSPENFTAIPEQRTFKCLMLNKDPNVQISAIQDKIEPTQAVFLCVKRDARDYIRNGRTNLHCLLSGNMYNINSDEKVAPFLDKEFFVFKLDLVK